MTNSHRMVPSKRTLGDAAVDGLLSGAAAGVGMALALLVMGGLAGQPWHDILAAFDPADTASPLTGAITHLAIAAVYGAAFGAAWWAARRAWPRLRGWWPGLLYGGLLWLLAWAAAGARDSLSTGWLQAIAPVNFALAHLLYGLVLGVLVQKGQ